MQGIVGQASDFKLGGQLSVFFERLSQRSTELSCTGFDEERARKLKAIDEQCCGTVFFWVNTSVHARVCLSYEFRLWVFVRYARWRACQDSLSCWTRLALAKEEEDERWTRDLTWKVKTTLQSFAASTEPEWEREEWLSCLSTKKKCLSCQWAAEEAYTTVSCNNSVVSSDRLFRWATKSENKRTCFDAGLPWGKISPGFFDFFF